MDDLQQRLAAALAERYTVEREIGRGGMSIVFLASDPTLGRQVAIKVLRPELAASLGPDRFLDEIKVAARLKHPYILKLHEAGEARGLLYYSMPYVEGETLRQLLAREHTLSIPDALRIAQEDPEALDHAHRHNVIHRDIKPENILFEEGHAVVSDFGIAKAISEAGDRRTVPGIVLGTVDYMSPEQEQGIQELDGRTDIYSLGLVLYEMLVGQTPGPDSGVDSLTGKRSDVPVAVVRMLRTALARDRANRYPTAAEFVAALEQLTRARPIASRRRWTVGLAAASVVTIALVVWEITRPPVANALDATHIAVLYFDDLSADSSLRAVAAGLSEDLMDRLVQITALHVTSPYGVRPYRGSAGSAVRPDSIARALNVGTIVTGSLTSSAGVLRVTVRLVDGATGQALHSRQVQRPLGELFALQDTITADIAGFLRQRIGEAVVLRERRAGTTNVAAWQAVREGDVLEEQGIAAFRSGDDSAARRLLRGADSQYVRAHALDGRWSVPHLSRARLARTFAERLSNSRSPAEVRAALRSRVPQDPRFHDEWMRVALAYGEEAIRTSNGSNPEALELRGSLRYQWWVSGYSVAAESLAASERDLRAGVAAMPTLARGWASLSQLLRYTGRFAEAEDAAKQALDADAFLLEARQVYRTLLFTALNLEHYDEARSWCASGRARFPTDVEFRHCELRILGWSGRGAGAIRRARHLADSLERSGTTRTGVFPADRQLLLATLYARSGERDSALVLLRDARVAAESDSSASWFRFAQANIRLLLGERRAALDLIALGLSTDPQLRDYISRAVWFAPLHGDPEFQRLTAASPD